MRRFLLAVVCLISKPWPAELGDSRQASLEQPPDLPPHPRNSRESLGQPGLPPPLPPKSRKAVPELPPRGKSRPYSLNATPPQKEKRKSWANSKKKLDLRLDLSRRDEIADDLARRRAEAAAHLTDAAAVCKYLVDRGIEVVAVDLDNTLSNDHICGKEIDKIEKTLSEDFEKFAVHCQELKIAVVTMCDPAQKTFVDRPWGSAALFGEELVQKFLEVNEAKFEVPHTFAKLPALYENHPKFKSWHLSKVREIHGVEAGKVVLIDDSLRNIEAARKEGFLTIHVSTKEEGGGFGFKKLAIGAPLV